VGGGFFGRLPAGFGPADAPGYEQYAQAVARALTASAWARRASPRLVVEPGVAVVADALSLVGRVVAVKELRGNALAVVDASTFHTKPSGHRKPQPFSVIRPQGATGEEKLLDVTGSTCMERDYLLSQVRAAIAPGDYVRVDNVGAYTVTMSPTFIHPAPAVIVREDGGFRAARERQTLEQAFAACRF
jgi:diaminopimelate decarboxylase